MCVCVCCACSDLRSRKIACLFMYGSNHASIKTLLWFSQNRVGPGREESESLSCSQSSFSFWMCVEIWTQVISRPWKNVLIRSSLDERNKIDVLWLFSLKQLFALLKPRNHYTLFFYLYIVVRFPIVYSHGKFSHFVQSIHIVPTTQIYKLLFSVCRAPANHPFSPPIISDAFRLFLCEQYKKHWFKLLWLIMVLYVLDHLNTAVVVLHSRIIWSEHICE